MKMKWYWGKKKEMGAVYSNPLGGENSSGLGITLYASINVISERKFKSGIIIVERDDN